ncbi:hypothetical protein BGW41_005218 [Actinomortierella wolfii]|nr:hypothetical protein BGW41_005218 [Actinomortierella wolfii]
MPPFLTDMEVDLSAGTAAVANSTNSACRATYSEPLSEPLPMSRSTSGTHTSIRATPYSRETFLKLCSYSKLLGVPVLTEPLCSHVECWGMGRHIENAIHVPIREGDPYQVGDVLDAVSARGCQILRFDVYPWRYAENVDIIEIIGKPPFIETNVSCTPKKTLPISSFSGSSQNSGHNDKLLFNSSISSDMNDSYDIERVRNEQEDDEDESDDDDEDEDDEYSKGDSESVGNIKNENNNNTRHQLQQQQKQQQHQQPRPLFELVTSGIQVLGHPVQVLRPKSRFDHLWKVKIRGWDSSRPLSELYVGLNKTFGKARQVVELELLGIKTKRTFWPSGNILFKRPKAQAYYHPWAANRHEY